MDNQEKIYGYADGAVIHMRMHRTALMYRNIAILTKTFRKRLS